MGQTRGKNLLRKTNVYSVGSIVTKTSVRIETLQRMPDHVRDRTQISVCKMGFLEPRFPSVHILSTPIFLYILQRKLIWRMFLLHFCWHITTTITAMTIVVWHLRVGILGPEEIVRCLVTTRGTRIRGNVYTRDNWWACWVRCFLCGPCRSYIPRTLAES